MIFIVPNPPPLTVTDTFDPLQREKQKKEKIVEHAWNVGRNADAISHAEILEENDLHFCSTWHRLEMRAKFRWIMTTPVSVEGGVVKCGPKENPHWHAEVKFMGQDTISSCACDSEAEAGSVLQFAKDVVHAMTNAMGGRAVLVDGTDTVQ